MVDLSDFDYAELEDERPQGKQGGSTGEALYIAQYMGETVYVRHTEDAVDSESHGMCESYRVANIAADIVLRDLDIMPEQVYDEASGRIVVEDAGTPVEAFNNLASVDTDSYLDSMLAKRLVGDIDVHASNITVDNEGICHPIDMDFAGRYVHHTQSLDDPYQQIIEGTRRETDMSCLLPDTGIDRVEERARRMASEMDFDRIWEELRTFPHMQLWEHRDKLYTAVSWFEDEYSPDSLDDSVRSSLKNGPQPPHAIG